MVFAFFLDIKLKIEFMFFNSKLNTRVAGSDWLLVKINIVCLLNLHCIFFIFQFYNLGMFYNILVKGASYMTHIEKRMSNSNLAYPKTLVLICYTPPFQIDPTILDIPHHRLIKFRYTPPFKMYPTIFTSPICTPPFIHKAKPGNKG